MARVHANNKQKLINSVSMAQARIKDEFMRQYIQNWLLNASSKPINECLLMAKETAAYIKFRL